MRIFYEGADITKNVQVRNCHVHDTCGDRCDSLDITFENAAGWYRWQPAEDERILVELNGYMSGIMYVNTILPESGKFRIIATSLPCLARRKECRSYSDKSILEIMNICGASTHMNSELYGIEGTTKIPYIQQENESCAAFLHKLLTLEGAMLKCVNGKYTAIGIAYAQERNAGMTFSVIADQRDVFYSRSGTTLRTFTIKTPYAEATAEDTAVSTDHVNFVTGCIPARTNVQAGRWARGKLLCMNRKCERLEMVTGFNPGATAMIRVDVLGNTDATGDWLIDEAMHDLINEKTTMIMHRCIRSIQ